MTEDDYFLAWLWLEGFKIVPHTAEEPCKHEAIIGLDGKWHCQRCGSAIEMAVAHTAEERQ